MEVEIIKDGNVYTFLIGNETYICASKNVKEAIETFLSATEENIYKSIEKQMSKKIN